MPATKMAESLEVREAGETSTATEVERFGIGAGWKVLGEPQVLSETCPGLLFIKAVITIKMCVCVIST